MACPSASKRKEAVLVISSKDSMRKPPTRISKQKIELAMPTILSMAYDCRTISSISRKVKIPPALVTKLVKTVRPFLLQMWVEDARHKADRALSGFRMLE